MFRLVYIFIGILSIGAFIFTASTISLLDYNRKELARAESIREGELAMRAIRSHLTHILDEMQRSLSWVETTFENRKYNAELENTDPHKTLLKKSIDFAFFEKTNTFFELMFSTINGNIDVFYDYNAPGMINQKDNLYIANDLLFFDDTALYETQYSNTSHLFLIGRQEYFCSENIAPCWLYSGIRLSGESGEIDRTRRTINATMVVLKNNGIETYSFKSGSEHEFEFPESNSNYESRDGRWISTNSVGIHSVFEKTRIAIETESHLVKKLAHDLEKSASVLLIFSIIYLLLSYWLTRQLISKSVERVVNYAQSVSKNTVDMDTPVDRGNLIVELDQLQSLFGRLLGNLKKHANDCRIAERDAQIQRNIAENTNVELHRKNEKLILLNDQMEQFVYSASHDLKSPLTTIQGLVTLALMDIENNDIKEVRSILKKTEEVSTNMLTRIEDSLTLVKVDHVDFEPEEVNLRDIIERIWHELPEGPHGPVVLKTRLQHRDPISSCKPIITGALENLIGNAHKYSSPKNIERCVYVSTIVLDEHLHLTVSDNGVGIPKHFHDQMFKMFKRFDQQGLPGTGLGLSLVRKYAIKLGGSISFDDNNNLSNFTLVIPMRNHNQ